MNFENNQYDDQCSQSTLHISISPVSWEGSLQGNILFEVGDRKFPAYRTIIKWRSPVMAELMKCSAGNRFIVKGIKPDIFEKLLTFINHGKVSQLGMCAGELISAAEKFGIYKLVEQCRSYMPNWD